MALGRVLVCVEDFHSPSLGAPGPTRYPTSCWGNRMDPFPSDQLLLEPRELLTQLVIPAALAPHALSRLSKQAQINVPSICWTSCVHPYPLAGLSQLPALASAAPFSLHLSLPPAEVPAGSTVGPLCLPADPSHQPVRLAHDTSTCFLTRKQLLDPWGFCQV